MRKSLVTLRFALYGCKNRPFFYIVATNRYKPRNRGYLEQVGTFDPMPNTRNEKLASLNMDRIRYWLSVGARPSRPVAILFGLAGILPPHPHSLVVATKKRQALAVAAQTLQQAEMDKEVKEELVGSPKSKDNDTNHKDP
ncbi:small ribosomal subunit protein bS16m-like [Montipora foliosa]|uniref:small ribosomal subunit protein bS16m-like n=1 Tax=Montipora foliosa TaxID=591990 RepID=UPI0035F1E42E